jgi:MFS family permease
MSQTTSPAVAPPDDARGRAWVVLLAVMLTYVSLGAILGFVQGGIAPVLRTQGLSLSAMRWVYALYLPFGIAFLWAPWIDAWRWPWLGRRTGWIIPMQGIAVLAIAATAFHSPGPDAWGILLALGLVTTLAAATMDLAMDALTVELIADGRRTGAAAAKVAGISLGSVLGGGVLVALYPRLGWQETLWIIAGVMALSAIPVLALIGRDRAASGATSSQRAQLMRTLRKPGMQTRFIRLTLLVCTLLALFNFNRLLLVDMGVSLERIGSVLGTTAPLVNALACVLAPWLLRRWSVRRAAWLMAGLCLASAATVWTGFVLDSAATALTGSVLTTASVSSLYVVLGGLILEWAAGQQAATDYALLYGVGRLIGTAALMILPGLIQVIGWSAFLGAVAIAFAAAAWYFLRLFPQAAEASRL